MRLLETVPDADRTRVNETLWRSNAELVPKLARFIRENRLAVASAIAAYERWDRALIVEATWDAGNLEREELARGLRQRLGGLREGAVLALTASRLGVEDFVPAICRACDSILMRAEPPAFWIRKGPNRALVPTSNSANRE